MFLEDVVPDQPSRGAPDQDVSGEMLLSQDAHNAYARGERVCAHLNPFRWVFSRDDSRYAPGQHAVGRRKRVVIPCLRRKKVACGIVVERALSPEDDFRDLVQDDTIRKRFAAQYARLSRLSIT